MSAAAAVLWAAVVVMFGYGPAFCAVAAVRKRRAARHQPAPAPVVGLTDAEWAELTALQDKARAEFDFEQWEAEVTA